MAQATITTGVERFLRNVNVTAQKELEKAVRKAIAAGTLRPGEALTTSVTIANEKIDLSVSIFSKIDV